MKKRSRDEFRDDSNDKYNDSRKQGKSKKDRRGKLLLTLFRRKY